MKKEDTVERMTREPVGRLILRNAVPTIISMMVTAIYSMADTFYVSKLGTSASGAVGIIFSLMAMMQALGFTVGMGSGSLTSRLLGAGNDERASTVCSSAILLAFSAGTVFAVVANILNEQIVSGLGATETILPYAMSYGRYILFGAPFIITSFTMNNLLRFQGKANLAMVGLTAGGIMNIALDPLFIFVLDLGISGAAIATLVSQVISFSILLSMFIRKKTTTVLSPALASRKIGTYIDIVTTGLPSLFRQGMSVIAAIMLNVAAGKFGDAAVAGMSITTRVFVFILAGAIGLGQGFQPVCGINFGARKFGRVRSAFSFYVRTTTIAMAAAAFVVFAFAPEITRSFRDDDAVVAVGAVAMRFQACALPFHSLILGANMTFQTTGKKKAGIFLSSMRQGLLFIPSILILSAALGLRGVQAAQAVSDILSAAAAVPFIIAFFSRLGTEEKTNPQF